MPQYNMINLEQPDFQRYAPHITAAISGAINSEDSQEMQVLRDELAEILPLGMGNNTNVFNIHEYDDPQNRLVRFIQGLLAPYGLGLSIVDNTPLFSYAAAWRSKDIRDLVEQVTDEVLAGNVDRIPELIQRLLIHNIQLVINAGIHYHILSETDFPATGEAPAYADDWMAREGWQPRVGLEDISQIKVTMERLATKLSAASDEMGANRVFVMLRRTFHDDLNEPSKLQTWGDDTELTMADFAGEYIRIEELASEMLASSPFSDKWELGFQLIYYYAQPPLYLLPEDLYRSVFMADKKSFEQNVDPVTAINKAFYSDAQGNPKQRFQEAQAIIADKSEAERIQLLINLILGENAGGVQLTPAEIATRIHAEAYISKRRIWRQHLFDKHTKIVGRNGEFTVDYNKLHNSEPDQEILGAMIYHLVAQLLPMMRAFEDQTN